MEGIPGSYLGLALRPVRFSFPPSTVAMMGTASVGTVTVPSPIAVKVGFS